MKYIKHIDQTGKTTAVESYKSDKKFVNTSHRKEISEAEYSDFMANLPIQVIPLVVNRDPIAEIDSIRAVLESNTTFKGAQDELKVLKKSNEV